MWCGRYGILNFATDKRKQIICSNKFHIHVDIVHFAKITVKLSLLFAAQDLKYLLYITEHNYDYFSKIHSIFH